MRARESDASLHIVGTRRVVNCCILFLPVMMAGATWGVFWNCTFGAGRVYEGCLKRVDGASDEGRVASAYGCHCSVLLGPLWRLGYEVRFSPRRCEPLHSSHLLHVLLT